jgi:membrane fusion protein (multidrug efflux system)
MASTLEQPAAPPMSPRRKLIMLIAAGALALLGVIWAVPAWYYAHTHETTDDSQVDGHIVPVLAKVGGYVTAVAVKDNDSVRAGQLLVRIDSAEYRVKLAQSDADLVAARAMAGSRGNGGQAGALVASAAGQRSSLDAQVDAARAYHAKTESDLARQKELVAKQIVSAQALDDAEAAEHAAAAQVQSLERQAAAASAGVSGAEAGVRMADARVVAAEAARDNAALQLSYTTVTAPAAGTVAKKLVEIGQLVQPGQQMMSIVADTGVWVTANFKETQLAAMHPGQVVDIKIDAYGGVTAKGELESFSAATGARFALLPPDNATGNFTKVVQRVPVRIRVTQGLGPARPLRPGMSAVVSVKTK